MRHSTGRDLLEAIGVGHFNATMVIPYLAIAPATTDPKSSQVIIMARALQAKLYAMGATDVVNSGHIDAPTAAALEQVAGPNWMRMSWGGNIQAVLDYEATGTRLSPSGQPLDIGEPVATGDAVLGVLPDIPGGIITYAVGGYFLYRFLRKKRAR